MIQKCHKPLKLSLSWPLSIFAEIWIYDLILMPLVRIKDLDTSFEN